MRLGRGEERRERGVKQEEFLGGGAEARSENGKDRLWFGFGGFLRVSAVNF